MVRKMSRAKVSSTFIWTVFFLCCIFALSVFGASGLPDQHFTGWKTGHPSLNPAVWSWRQGSLGAPPYVPPDGNWSYPVVFIEPKVPVTPLRMRVRLSGYNANPGLGSSSNCHGADDSDFAESVIKPCAGHYPSVSDHNNGFYNALGWWGWFKGDSNTYRLGISLWESRLNGNTDYEAGWICDGVSYGATGCLLQSMLMSTVDTYWHERLAVVLAVNPHTLPVTNRLYDYAPVDAAWRYPPELTDSEFRKERLDPINFQKQAGWRNVQQTYYRLVGSPVDTQVNFDLAFIDIANSNKVAGYGTWHGCGHVTTPGPSCSADLPWSDKLYPGDDMVIRSDQMLIAFNNSTADHVWCGPSGNEKAQPCINGHWNLGWSYNTESEWFFDDPLGVIVPIRYKRSLNMGAGVPDQPVSATVDVTIRRIKHFSLVPGQRVKWSVSANGGKGVAVVTHAGEVTLEGVRLTSSTEYRLAVIEPYTEEDKEGFLLTSTPVDLRPLGNGVEDRGHLQNITDVKNIIGEKQITESDVRYSWDGEKDLQYLYNCTGDPLKHCAAGEYDVAPNGWLVAYTVIHASGMYDNGTHVLSGVNRSEIRFHDLRDGSDWAMPDQQPDVHYRTPRFINNDKIVYTSTEAKTWPNKDRYHCHRGMDKNNVKRWEQHDYCSGQEYDHHSFNLYTALVDGSNRVNITPEQMMCIRPEVLKHPRNKGRIVASCVDNLWDQSYDKTGGASGTRANQWELYSWNNDGTDMTVILGGHKGRPLKKKELLDSGVVGGQYEDELLAIRAVGELEDGELCANVYYRANHYALGYPVCFFVDDFHTEGAYYAVDDEFNPGTSTWPGSGKFSRGYTIAPAGTGQDVETMRNSEGLYMGKGGFVRDGGDGYPVITWCRGNCLLYAGASTLQPEYLKGEPTARRGIYRIRSDLITDPFDKKQLEPLFVSDTEHYWDALRIRKTSPAPPAPLRNPSAPCYLEVTNMRNSELSPAYPFDPLRYWGHHAAVQGSAVKPDDPEFFKKEIHSLAIYGYDRYTGGMKDNAFRKTINKSGLSSVYLMGEQPIQKDGSVRVRVECEKKFKMAGHDKLGRKIANDPHTHSLRKGETRRCHGCHDGHSEKRAAEINDPNFVKFDSTEASRTEPPLLNAKKEVRWPTVRDILVKRCNGCHKEINDSDGLLYDSIVWDRRQEDLKFLSKIPTLMSVNASYNNHPRRWWLNPPHTSGLLAHFYRESRLGWYVEDARLDGRKNTDYEHDFDFKAPHNSGVTEEEKKIIRLWVNVGAPL